MKYTAGTTAAQKIFSGDSGRVRAGCLPNGLPFKRNRKFKDKKAKSTKKAMIAESLPALLP
jgi:hypothetical protein